MTKETFANFSDVAHSPLRTFNRVVMVFNITSDFGKEVAEEYISQFSEGERAQMAMVTMAIKTDGVDAVRKLVTRGLEIEDDELAA